MGLLDDLGLGGMLGQLEGSALPGLINTVLAQTQFHDLNGLVAALQKGGLDTQVKSWLGNGANLPVSADQLKAVLGNSQIQDFARQLGIAGRRAAQNARRAITRYRRQSEPERHLAAARVNRGSSAWQSHGQPGKA